MYCATPASPSSWRSKLIPTFLRIHMTFCFFKPQLRPVLLGLFHGFQRIRQFHTRIAENDVEIAGRQRLCRQIEERKGILAPGKSADKRIALLQIFCMLFLNEADSFLFQTCHQSMIHFIEPVDIHGLELQPILCQKLDRRFRIKTAALRLGDRLAVQDIPTDPFCPEQWCVRILRIIPIGIHAEKIQFFMEDRTDFLLYLCINRQPIDAVFLRPFISIQVGTVSLLSHFDGYT